METDGKWMGARPTNHAKPRHAPWFAPIPKQLTTYTVAMSITAVQNSLDQLYSL